MSDTNRLVQQQKTAKSLKFGFKCSKKMNGTICMAKTNAVQSLHSLSASLFSHMKIVAFLVRWLEYSFMLTFTASTATHSCTL